MRGGRSAWLAAIAAISVLACAAPPPTRTPPQRTAEATPTNSPATVSSPSPALTLVVDPNLHVDGIATVLVDGLTQVVDPAHSNHDRNLNERLGKLSSGEKVYLVGTTRYHGDTFWKVARSAGGSAGPLGWISDQNRSEGNLEPFQPACPSSFPLTAADLVALGSLQALSCLRATELTLTGMVHCDRPIVDFFVGGASFLDAHRSCDLDDQFGLAGNAVTSLPRDPGGRGVDNGSVSRGWSFRRSRG